MKNLLFIFLVTSTIIFVTGNLVAQETNNTQYLKVNFGKTFHTTGDFRGFIFGTGYGKSIGNRIKLNFNFHIAHASNNGYDNFQKGKKYTFISEEVDNPFKDIIITDSLYYNSGIKKLKTHLNRVTQMSFDAGVGYDLINVTKHQLTPGIGLSLAYKDESGHSGNYPGTFDGTPYSSVQDIVIVQPYYTRIYDFGTFLKLDYDYNINEHVFTGLTGTWRYYFSSSDMIYSVSIVFGTRF